MEGGREVGWHRHQLSLYVKEEVKCFVELLVFLFVLTHSTHRPSFMGLKRLCGQFASHRRTDCVTGLNLLLRLTAA